MSYLRSYSEIIDSIDAIDPVDYAKTRNQLSGAVTRLSPYISRGIVSLPLIRERLLANHAQSDCEKLIQELAWREYFQNVWWENEDAIFSDIRFSRDDWRHDRLVSALVDANTGIEVIDQGIKELYDTGYMHNHLRMWVASVACNLARAHWHEMGRWMFHHLIDGDPASNFLSWQWVAGTSVNKRYTVNQSLINGCSENDQSGTFLEFERDQMGEVGIPEVLRTKETFALTAEYPTSEALSDVSGFDVHLYTPWTLDAKWRKDESARRILIIDPTVFDRYPVSTEVFDFIVRQGSTVIQDLEVFVGRAHEVPGIANASLVRTIEHQTNRDWLAQFDEQERLFPHVRGYFPSFFKYWQAVTRS